MNNEIIKTYGNRIRIRVCGICIQNNKILLVKHKSITRTGFFYSPPGGGIDDGETAIEALKREFLEETDLQVEVGELLFVNDFVKPPLHGVELFFEIKIVGGELKIGQDPETNQQIIEDINWYSFEDLKMLREDEKANFLKQIKDFEGIYSLSKYIS